ncbi:disease resistance protein Pik-2-like [Triticum dicoccoides]|uniref:Disease resistance R13L4/SHOC-2-like LRR domain-containing protein n=2 Tax=Triticum TaxID=4564 RepID=A0A9R0YZL4_TRITD|nr:disease resistance protein Pik-2-like [Triticum dicoccoides]VAI68492.1 unnamed protein product [Triticum turgidum subsp. durum]
MCFNELINRSLIRPMEIDRTFGDQVESCRLHDTIFDFIVSKAVEENFVTVIGVPGVVNPDSKGKVRRVSLQNDGEIPLGLDVSHARSLHVFGSNAKIPSLLECQLLRVLDFNECLQLEDDHLAGVGNLWHLKYLRFKHAHALTKLPEQVARLRHLEIDIYGYNKVMEIPVIIQQQLTCYVTLSVDDYVTVTDEVAEMQVLWVLEGLNVYTQSIQFLERLGQLKNLRKLSILFNSYDSGDNWEEYAEKLIYSICELSKAGLESLHIDMNEATNEYFEGPWFPDPSCGLRELTIHGGVVSKVPAWMASLIKLEKLYIPMDTIMEQDVEILGALPSLHHLCIEHDKDAKLELKAAMEKAMKEHPNRPTLVWKFYD